jgi:hypothetical protein
MNAMLCAIVIAFWRAVRLFGWVFRL